MMPKAQVKLKGKNELGQESALTRVYSSATLAWEEPLDCSGEVGAYKDYWYGDENDKAKEKVDSVGQTFEDDQPQDLSYEEEMERYENIASTSKGPAVVDYHETEYTIPSAGTTTQGNFEDKAEIDIYEYACYFCPFFGLHSKNRDNHMKRAHREEYNQMVQRAFLNSQHNHKAQGEEGLLKQNQPGGSSEKSHIDIYQNRNPPKKKPAKTKKKSLICDICGLVLQNKTMLLNHKDFHVMDKLFQCKECGNKYPTSNSLQYHQQEDHGVKKTYQCQLCGKEFTRKGFLRAHKRVHSLPENQYKCFVCDITFSNSSSFYQHKKSHSLERPYKCGICEAAFAYNSVLKDHMATHVQYACEICHKSFVQKRYLQQHKKIHVDMCDIRSLPKCLQHKCMPKQVIKGCCVS